ncbi:aspartate aminotransferase [Pelomyxa schiedti]|nr:aspartate aminotransferase [Pelomyxa schiedti]
MSDELRRSASSGGLRKSVSFEPTTMIAGGARDELKGSAIRKMFQLGLELKKSFGAANVFDFSLGNPALEPPPEFEAALLRCVTEHGPMSHGYMPNQGLLECRTAVATLVSRLQGVYVDPDRVIMSVGAAGGINVVLKTIISPGDEVIRLIPYFLDYEHYITIPGGVIVTAPTQPNYEPDVNALRAAITPKTRAIIINSPNNPTGKVYSQEVMNDVGELLAEKSQEYGRPIYIISDEPYARLIYGGAKNYSAFDCYNYSFVISSVSKDLSLPGERLGYVVANPDMPHWPKVKADMIQWTRALGFVNAPALIQRAVAMCLESSVDINWYANNRDLLCSGLQEAGLEIVFPEGAFYAFPKCPPGVTSEQFCDALAKENVLCVPGTPFGMPFHVRFCYAVSPETITGAIPKIIKSVAAMKTTTTTGTFTWCCLSSMSDGMLDSGELLEASMVPALRADVVVHTMPLVLPSLVNVYDHDVPAVGPILEAMEFHKEEEPMPVNDKMWAYKHGSGAPLVLNQSESVRQFFDSIREKKFATVSVLGPTRTGKSTLLNYAIQILQGTNTDPFVTSDNLKFGCTSGIWFFPSLINIPGCEIPVLLVDVEGLYAVDPMSSRRKSDVDQYYFTRLWILDLADAISDFKSNRQSDILLRKNCPSLFAYIAQNFGQTWTLEQDGAFWKDENELESKLPPEFEKLFPNRANPFNYFTLPPCSYEGRPDVPTHADFIAKLKQILLQVGTLTTSPLRLVGDKPTDTIEVTGSTFLFFIQTVLEAVNGKLETPQMVKVVDFYCDSKRLEALDAVFADAMVHFNTIIRSEKHPISPSFVQVAIGLAMKFIEDPLGKVVAMKRPTVEGKTKTWDLARFKREVEDRITAESEALTNKFRQEAATFCAEQVAIAVRDFFLHTTDLTSSEALMEAAHKKMQELTSQLQRFDPLHTESIDTFIPAVKQRLNEHTNAATVALHVVMRRVAEPFFQALGKNLPADVNVDCIEGMYHSELFDSNGEAKQQELKCSDVNTASLQELDLLNAYNNESKNIHPACRFTLPFVTEQLRRLHNTLAAEGAKALHVMQWVELESCLRCVMRGGCNGPPLPIKSCEDFQTIQRWTGADILQLVWAPSFECLKGQILDRFMQHGERLQQWLLDKQVDVSVADTIVQIFCESVAVIFSKIPLPACFDLTVVFPGDWKLPTGIDFKFSASLPVNPVNFVHLGTIENLSNKKIETFQFSLNPLDDGRKAQELKRHLEKLPFGPRCPSAEVLYGATKFFCQRVEYIWTFFEPKCQPETAAITGYQRMVFETTGEYPRDARIVIDNNRTFLAFPLPFSKDLGIALSLRFPASIGALELCPQVHVTAPSVSHLFRFLLQAQQPIIDVSSSSCSPTDGSSGEFVVTVISTDNLCICASKQTEITVTLLPPPVEVQSRPTPGQRETACTLSKPSLKRVLFTNDDRFENLKRYTTPSLEVSVLSKPWDSFTWRKTFNKYAQRCIDNNTPVWRDELIVHLQILSAGFTLHALNPSSPGVYFLINEKGDDTCNGSPAAFMAEITCSKEEERIDSGQGLLCGVFHPPTKALSKAHNKLAPSPQHPALNSATEVFIVNMDCLHVAQQLMQQFPGELTAVLNMANSTTPGGGFENGKSAQEEDLCMRTSLFPALKQIGYPLPLCGAIFTRDVTVFRNGSSSGFQFLTDTWTVNVISAAALHNVDNKFTVRDPRTGEVFLSPTAAMITRYKIEQLLNTAAMYNMKQLVLGVGSMVDDADVAGHVAAIFKEVLQQYAGCFSRVYFTTLPNPYSPSDSPKLFRAFSTHFGPTGSTPTPTRGATESHPPRTSSIKQAVGPCVMPASFKTGRIPLSHTVANIRTPGVICPNGGTCTDAATGHFGAMIHPPPCPCRLTCACTSPVHRAMWRHRVKCQQEGRCLSYFSAERDLHCSLFWHPPPRWSRTCRDGATCPRRVEAKHCLEYYHAPPPCPTGASQPALLLQQQRGQHVTGLPPPCYIAIPPPQLQPASPLPPQRSSPSPSPSPSLTESPAQSPLLFWQPRNRSSNRTTFGS